MHGAQFVKSGQFGAAKLWSKQIKGQETVIEHL